MIDTLALLLSHGMIVYVLWRLMNLRDPDEAADVRFRPDQRK